MTTKAYFTISGEQDIQRVLLSLPREFQKRALVNAFKAGAEIVAKEARLQAQAQGIDVFDDGQEEYRDSRRKTTHKGQFWENIVVQVSSFRRGRFVGNNSVVKVGVRKGFSQLAHLFEFGTTIRRRKNGGGSTGQIIARPFLRPALDEAGPAAIKEITRVSGENVEIIAKQLARKRGDRKKVSLGKRARKQFLE